MAQITLNATKRETTGKAVKKLRNAGQLPAVLYGHGVKAENVQINEREFAKVLRQAGESTIITLSVDGKNHPVLIHDVHNHYLKDTPIHVDLYAVNMNETLKATVQVHFIGESPAVKTLGAILAKNKTEVEVECLPADLPSHFEVDLSALVNMDDAIRVEDIKVSDKVKILATPDEVLVAATPPRSEEEMKELDEKPVVADVTAVEGVVKPTDTPEGAAAAAEPKEKAKE